MWRGICDEDGAGGGRSPGVIDMLCNICDLAAACDSDEGGDKNPRVITTVVAIQITQS